MWPDCLSSVLAPAAALDTCTAFLRAESKLHTALLMGGWRGLVGLGVDGGDWFKTVYEQHTKRVTKSLIFVDGGGKWIERARF